MQRRMFIVGVGTAIAGALMVFLFSSRHRHSFSETSLSQTVRAAATNPVEFAKSRLQGGIGVTLRTDPATGFLAISGVAIGSPAEKAGVLVGDLITGVDGVSVTNRPTIDVVKSIRGLSVGTVTLAVLRGGSTNLEVVVPRSSWNNLRDKSFNPYE